MNSLAPKHGELNHPSDASKSITLDLVMTRRSQGQRFDPVFNSPSVMLLDRG